MNKVLYSNFVRIILVILVQVIVFKYVHIPIGNIGAAHAFIYPVAILLLPIRVNLLLSLVVAFLIGLTIDIFYDSLGVHAAAMLITAYIRPLILAFLEPYEGYNTRDIPTIRNFGLSWFFSYASILLIIHLFTLFSLEAFSYIFIFEIFINTVFTFFVSMLIILILQYLFRPTI